MNIGNSTGVPEAKTHLDRATSLIIPVMEHLIPLELDQALAAREHGDCVGPLTLQRVLRLELLQPCYPQFSFHALLRQVWQLWAAARLAPGDCPSSAALAKARERLPVWAVEMVFKATVRQALPLFACSPWPGHRLLSIDGTMLSAPRTAENAEYFGMTRSQHGPAYYPQALLVWICGVQQGTVLQQTSGTARQSDQRLGPDALRAFLQAGDLVFGDGHYGHYGALNVVHNAAAYYLMRVPANFKIAPRVVRVLGSNDLAVRLTPSYKIRRHYSHLNLQPELHARALSLMVPAKDADNGIERADFLTNLPQRGFPSELIARLLRIRWDHETINNDIKTRLGLTYLRSEQVAGIQREVFAHLSMNNAIRLALHAAQPLGNTASFIAAAQALAEANAQLRAVLLDREGIWAAFYLSLTQHPIPVRPRRSEPRKRRPYKTTGFPIFKRPRVRFQGAPKEAHM
jgi:hypothetical protein